MSCAYFSLKDKVFPHCEKGMGNWPAFSFNHCLKCKEYKERDGGVKIVFTYKTIDGDEKIEKIEVSNVVMAEYLIKKNIQKCEIPKPRYTVGDEVVKVYYLSEFKIVDSIGYPCKLNILKL